METATAALADLRVGDVSHIGRGRHTTRSVTLLPVAGGLLADTPGFNQPALEGVLPEELASYFPEIQESIPE
jgi:ribosome biogenesis GTPase